MPDTSTIALFLSILWPSIAGAIYWFTRRKATAKAEQLSELAQRTADFEKLLGIYKAEVLELRQRVERQDIWIQLLEDKLRSLNQQLPVPPWAYRRGRDA